MQTQGLEIWLSSEEHSLYIVDRSSRGHPHFHKDKQLFLKKHKLELVIQPNAAKPGGSSESLGKPVQNLDCYLYSRTTGSNISVWRAGGKLCLKLSQGVSSEATDCRDIQMQSRC